MSSRSSSRRRELGGVVFWAIVGGAMFTIPGLPFLLGGWNTLLAYYCGFWAGIASVLAWVKIVQIVNPLETVKRKLNIGGISK